MIAVIKNAGFSEQVLERDAESTKFKEQLVMLVGSDPRSMRVFGLSSDEKPVLHEYSVILPEQHASRLPSEHISLAQLRIGIVGLGSIGSKVAISMVRSGVRKFLLIDDDFLIPGNLSRHELSWATVGLHKTEALREALSLVAPEIEVSIRTHRVAGQESALIAAGTLKDLGNCDVLIDATGNPAVFLLLAAIAKMNRRPLCWGEVFAGGFGGLIARARPNLDPNPLALRAGILNYFQQLPPAPHQRAIGYDIGAEEPLIAYDGDIGQIASALTRLTLDTALQRKPSQFPYSAYLIGLRSEWIFTEPFNTRPIEVTGDGWNDDVVAKEDHNEALKILLEIAAAQQDDYSRSSA
jgi:molybdopterin/thiamine biosynthesis adenylyltransferase